MREPAATRRPAFIAVSVVGQKGKTHWIVSDLYVIDAADVASSDEAVDRALCQFAEAWPDYAVVTTTKKAIGQANPPKNGKKEDAQNVSGRQIGRPLEESHAQS